MKKKLKIGIIGTGFMGQVAHLQNFLQIDDCEIVAIADARPEQRLLVRNKYQIPNAYQDHNELIKHHKNLDGIVVVTPRNMTGPIAFECLKNGFHTFTEKPMCSSFHQGKELVRLAKEKKLVYSIGNMRRHDLGVKKGKEIFDDLMKTKQLGELTYVRLHSFDSKPYCNEDNYIQTKENLPNDLPYWSQGPDWLPKEKVLDYAFFINVFCHNINIMRFFLNNNSPKIGYTNLKNMNSRLIVFEYPNINVLLEAGRSSSRNRDEFCEFYFEDGLIKIIFPSNLARNQPAKLFVKRYGDFQNITEHVIDWSWAFRRQAEAFLSDITNNNLNSFSSGADSLNDISICEQIWKNELKIN